MEIRWATDLTQKFKNHLKIIKPGQHIFIYKSRGTACLTVKRNIQIKFHA